ncbi:potassium channel, partial [Aureococcus anophagefferens]
TSAPDVRRRACGAAAAAACPNACVACCDGAALVGGGGRRRCGAAVGSEVRRRRRCAATLESFCDDPPARSYDDHALTFFPGPRAAQSKCFGRFQEAHVHDSPDDAALSRDMRATCCSFAALNRERARERRTIQRAIRGNLPGNHPAGDRYLMFPRSQIEAARAHASASTRDVDVNFLGRLHGDDDGSPLLDYVLREDYDADVFSTRVAASMRVWLGPFVDAFFTAESVLVDTSITDAATYVSRGAFDKTSSAAGFRPMSFSGVNASSCKRATCDPAYYEKLARSRFTLAPAGDMPWSLRFFEAIMAGSVPILSSKEHAGRNRAEKTLGYKYLLVSEYVARRKRFPGAAPYCAEWADHNLAIFLEHQSYIEDPTTAPLIMGQAESSTVKSSQDEESIYFQTSLVVEGERLSPIAYYQESADDATSTASSAFFCAEAGSKFEIKVTLARPPPEGVLYGARVYVDSGAPDVVYEACGPGRGSDASAASTTDRSTPDHYFWLGPGETEYVVRGFFANKLESYPFAFGSAAASSARSALADANGEAAPPEKRARVDDAAARAANELGCLRLQFAKVTRFVAVDATPGPTAPRRASLRGAAAELADAKGTHIAAKAGREAEADDAGASALAAEAVLSPKIIHESRLFYNDFAGYRARSSLGKAMLEPLTFQGLPLSCFAQADVRRRCVDAMLAAKQRAGADVATKKRIW